MRKSNKEVQQSQRRATSSRELDDFIRLNDISAATNGENLASQLQHGAWLALRRSLANRMISASFNTGFEQDASQKVHDVFLGILSQQFEHATWHDGRAILSLYVAKWHTDALARMAIAIQLLGR